MWYSVYKNHVHIVKILLSDPRLIKDTTQIAAEMTDIFSKLNRATKLLIDTSTKKVVSSEDLSRSQQNQSYAADDSSSKLFVFLYF